MAPQVGLERCPKFLTADTILFKFLKNTRKTSIGTGFHNDEFFGEKREKRSSRRSAVQKRYKFWALNTGAIYGARNESAAHCSNVFSKG